MPQQPQENHSSRQKGAALLLVPFGTPAGMGMTRISAFKANHISHSSRSCTFGRASWKHLVSPFLSPLQAALPMATNVFSAKGNTLLPRGFSCLACLDRNSPRPPGSVHPRKGNLSDAELPISFQVLALIRAQRGSLGSNDDAGTMETSQSRNELQ